MSIIKDPAGIITVIKGNLEMTFAGYSIKEALTAFKSCEDLNQARTI